MNLHYGACEILRHPRGGYVVRGEIAGFVEGAERNGLGTNVGRRYATHHLLVGYRGLKPTARNG